MFKHLDISLILLHLLKLQNVILMIPSRLFKRYEVKLVYHYILSILWVNDILLPVFVMWH